MANEIVNPQITDAVTQGTEKLLTFKEICQAVVDGKQLQSRGDSMSAWHDIDMSTMDFMKKSHQYRIKPENKYEPWNFITCPRSGWTRVKTGPTTLFAINAIAEGGTNGYTFDDLLRDCEYSVNGIDGWRPAGRRVEG